MDLHSLAIALLSALLAMNLKQSLSIAILPYSILFLLKRYILLYKKCRLSLLIKMKQKRPDLSSFNNKKKKTKYRK